MTPRSFEGAIKALEERVLKLEGAVPQTVSEFRMPDCWFAHDPHGESLTLHDTLEEAEAAADLALARYWEEDRDGDRAQQVTCGRFIVLRRATKFVVEDLGDEAREEYQLETVPDELLQLRVLLLKLELDRERLRDQVAILTQNLRDNITNKLPVYPLCAICGAARAK